MATVPELVTQLVERFDRNRDISWPRGTFSFSLPVAFSGVHWRFHSPSEIRIAEGKQK
jgi:hypothetical protein